MAGDAAPFVVLDASVAVKWFVTDGEEGVHDARELLALHSSGEVRLVAPALVAHELLGVLARRSRDAADLRDAMEAFFDAGVTLAAPDRDMALAAADLISQHRIHALDSAYAALALSLSCELATADRRLARALDGVVRLREV